MVLFFGGSVLCAAPGETRKPEAVKNTAQVKTPAAPASISNPEPIYVDPTVSRRSDPGYGWLFLRTIFVLGLFGGAAVLIWRWLKNRQPARRAEEGPIRILQDYPLAIAKSLKVVEVGREVFLIGVTQDQVSLIGRLEDKETLDALRLAASRVQAAPRASFGELLLRVMPGASGKPGATKPLDLTRNLKEKLGRMK